MFFKAVTFDKAFARNLILYFPWIKQAFGLWTFWQLVFCAVCSN